MTSRRHLLAYTKPDRAALCAESAAQRSGAFIAIADWEWFSPLDGDPAERFASRHRLRFGLGHRANARWRFDAIHIWLRSRNTFDEPFGSADHILDVHTRMNF